MGHKKKRAREKETREGRGSACTEGPRKSFPASSGVDFHYVVHVPFDWQFSRPARLIFPSGASRPIGNIRTHRVRVETIFGGLPCRRSLTPRVSQTRAPVLSFTHYFQAPATQATRTISCFLLCFSSYHTGFRLALLSYSFIFFCGEKERDVGNEGTLAGWY